MASLVSIYLIILVLNITIVNFIVYRINIVFNTYIFLCINVNYKLDSLISNIYIILLEILMKILINLVTSICLITLMALFEYNKINSIIYVVLSILCLILNFSLIKYIKGDK